MRYWVGKSLNIIAWFVYFYSIYMYLFTFPIYICIQNTFQLQSSPFHITQSLILNSFSSTQGEWGPPEYPRNMTSQVSATEVRQGSQVRLKRLTGWTDRQYHKGHPPTLFVPGPMWTLKHIYYIYGGALAHPVFALWLVGHSLRIS